MKTNFITQILTLLLLPCLIQCKSKKNADFVQTKVAKESIIWHYDMKTTGLSSNMFVFEGLLVFGHETEENYTFVGVSLDSGKLVWENAELETNWIPQDVEETSIYENFLIISVREVLHVIDMRTGKTHWVQHLDYGNSLGSVIDGWFYKPTNVSTSRSTLHRYNVVTGAHEALFTIDKKDHDGFDAILCSPAKWVNSNGDEYLILSNRSYNWLTSARRMDVMAYNLTQDTMVYYREGVDINSSSSKPIVEENRVYFYGMFDAYCLDAATGETLWNFTTHPEDLEGDFNTANILIHKDILIVKPDSRWMYGVNKYTGKLIWTNRNTRAMPGALNINNEIIWFSSGAVVAVDANTGDKLIDWNYYQGSWIFPVAFHPTKNWIYTSNARYVYCLDPEVMKTQMD